MVFNLFTNEIFYLMEQSTLYNYVSHTMDDEDELMAWLESDLSNLMSWFKTNCLGINIGNHGSKLTFGFDK